MHGPKTLKERVISLLWFVTLMSKLTRGTPTHYKTMLSPLFHLTSYLPSVLHPDTSGHVVVMAYGLCISY